jgi:hypothetical protein
MAEKICPFASLAVAGAPAARVTMCAETSSSWVATMRTAPSTPFKPNTLWIALS